VVVKRRIRSFIPDQSLTCNVTLYTERWELQVHICHWLIIPDLPYYNICLK